MMRFFTIFLILGCNACAHAPAEPRSSAVSVRYGVVEQTRLDTYKVIFAQHASPSSPLTATIFLHGAGGNMEDMSEMFPPSNGELFIFVEAPYIAPYAIRYGMRGFNAWPRQADDREITDNNVIAPALRLEADHLWRIIADVRTKHPIAKKINIVGMSQGGVLAYHMATRNKGDIGRIAFLFSPVKDLMFGEKLPTKERLNVLVVHNKDDSAVSFREALFVRDIFQKSGSQVTSAFEDTGGHGLSQTQKEKLRAFLLGRNSPPAFQ